MSKTHYLPFSRFYPKGHPKEGEPTYFIEKIWESIGDAYFDQYPAAVLGDFQSKHHTIRQGNRFNPGDVIIPFAWSDKPYRSKWIRFSPKIEVKKVWRFEMDECGVFSLDGFYVLDEAQEETLCKNDGLEAHDFYRWFMPRPNKPKPFSGQIICWNENVNY